MLTKFQTRSGSTIYLDLKRVVAVEDLTPTFRGITNVFLEGIPNPFEVIASIIQFKELLGKNA